MITPLKTPSLGECNGFKHPSVQTAGPPTRFEELVVVSQAMKTLSKEIGIAAATGAPLLLVGEPGTGKKLVARYIHHRGDRADQPFAGIDCAAAPDIVDAQLFAEESGIFAKKTFTSTLFLRRVDQLSVCAQGKLLRVLEKQLSERVSEGNSLQKNIRVIASVTRNSANLRSDLFYEFAPIPVPSLHERADDVGKLVAVFLKEEAGESNQTCGITQQVVEFLATHRWPGNVRELRDIIRKAALSARTSTDRSCLINPVAIRDALLHIRA